MASRRFDRKSLDAWFPTIVRYAGVGLVIYGAITQQVTLITAAAGMILFKTVYGDGGRE